MNDAGHGNMDGVRRKSCSYQKRKRVVVMDEAVIPRCGRVLARAPRSRAWRGEQREQEVVNYSSEH
jgi:hypothetical protein